MQLLILYTIIEGGLDTVMVVTDTTSTHSVTGLAHYSYLLLVCNSKTNSFGTSAPSATWAFTTMWYYPPTWFGNLIIKDFSPVPDSVAITSDCIWKLQTE
jgi:hypothetical protein